MRRFVVAVLCVPLVLVATQPSSAQTPQPSAAPCIGYPAQGSRAEKWPPPMLPVALAARYPNGVWVSADVDVDASGRVLGVKPHLSDYYRYSIFGYWPDDSAISQAQIVKVKRDLAGPLGRFVISWAKTATYGPMTQSLSSKRNCVPHETVYLDLSFYPPDSGVTAQPPIFDGVDFDELTYKGGPCDSSEKAKMHYGESQYYYAPIDSNVIASVKLIFAGKVGGAAVAVVVLECGGPVWAD